MRVRIVIDDTLLAEAQEWTGARTKRETVDLALRELVALRRQRDVLALRGRIRWEGDLEVSRAMRDG